jgi:excinuclease ABC subunit C
LQRVPTRAGVAQILGPGGKPLLTARAANLRRWAASQLGMGPPPKPGRRPRTDLSPVATAIAFLETSSGFHQRLVFERLMAPLVPRSARRDLRTPAYLHLDPAERFPRVTVRTSAAGAEVYGPFRDRGAAARARDALHRVFPLRPCDYTFEPASDLALGLSCLYAQVRTCAAPCLMRVGEEDYRALAEQAAEFLGRPVSRGTETAAWAPSWVARGGGRGLVAERTRSLVELYPVVAGSVREEDRVTAAPGDLEQAVASLHWRDAGPERDDIAWLLAWLAGTRTGAYLAAAEQEAPAELAQRVTAALGAPRRTAKRQSRVVD